jgi:hypothetical protein
MVAVHANVGTYSMVATSVPNGGKATWPSGIDSDLDAGELKSGESFVPEMPLSPK